MAQKTKSGKRFVKTAAATALLVASVLGMASCSSKNNAGRISDESQVETIAAALDCDLSYMKHNKTGGVVRMMHNGDEPIYVHITDEMNEEENKLIEESLEYVFGIVGKINDNYKYEIVDKSEYNKQKTLGKTAIIYQEGPCDSGKVDTTGQIRRDLKEASGNNINDYYTHHRIEYDRAGSSSQEYDDKLYTFIHELLHAFGLDDVYLLGPNKDTDINYQNTIMKSYSSGGNIITPNDLKCLFSAYAKPLEGVELEAFINKANQISKDYEDFYYQNRVDKIINYEENKVQNLNGQDVNSKFNTTFIDLDGSQTSQEVSAVIEGDKYTLKFSGGGREEECIATGDVMEIDGVKVLKNVRFTGTFELSEAGTAKESIMDLYIVRLDNRDMLYEANSLSSMWGKNLELEVEKK